MEIEPETEPEHVEVVFMELKHVDIAAAEPDGGNANVGETDHNCPFWTGLV